MPAFESCSHAHRLEYICGIDTTVEWIREDPERIIDSTVHNITLRGERVRLEIDDDAEKEIAGARVQLIKPIESHKINPRLLFANRTDALV